MLVYIYGWVLQHAIEKKTKRDIPIEPFPKKRPDLVDEGGGGGDCS